MEINDAVTILNGLAQQTRLAIYRHLVQAGPEGVRAGMIAEELALADATSSFHLTQLCHAGLLTSRREGRRIVYSVDFATMNQLVGYLTENCCGGVEQCNTVGDSICSTNGS
jgi:predicted transcriptional regulator